MLSEQDQTRLALLYQEHGAFLLRIAKGILREQADAEDAVQDAFFHMIDPRTGELRGPLSPAYLVTAVKNCAYDIHQKNKEKLRLEERQAAGAPEGWGVQRQVENRECIREKLKALPMEDREIFVLYEAYGYRQKEIALWARLPLEVVKKRIQRGRKKVEAV